MDSLHLTRELLRALADGTRTPGDLVSTVMSHLFDLCPTCAGEFAAFKEETRGGDTLAYSPVIDRVRERIGTAQEELGEERRGVVIQLEELLSMPHSERLETVRGADSEFSSPALAVLLLEASRDSFLGRPRRALQLAELARAVLLHGETSALKTELYAQAIAYGGNAARVAGDKHAAVERFEYSRFLLRSVGGGDRQLQAELDRFEGSLCLDLRDMERAHHFFQRALMVYCLEEDFVGAATVLLKIALALNINGEQEEAIEALGEALDLLDPEENPRIHLFCEHSLAMCLSDSGRYREARRIMQANQARYQRYGDQLTLLRVAWIHGRIALGLGEPEEAEFQYLIARRGFYQAGISFDAALVSLELAALYLEQGRTAEVKRLAGELVQEFTRQHVPGETLAALMLFEDAARLENLTPAFIGELSSYLERASRDPSYVFQTAS